MSDPNILYFAIYADPEFKSEPLLLAQVDRNFAPTPEAAALSDKELMQQEVVENEQVLGHLREITGQEKPDVYCKQVSAKEFLDGIKQQTEPDMPGQEVINRVCPICLIDDAAYDPPFDTVMPSLCPDHAKQMADGDDGCVLFISDAAKDIVPDIQNKMTGHFAIPPAMIRRYFIANRHLVALLLAHNRPGQPLDPKDRSILFVVPDSAYEVVRTAVNHTPNLVPKGCADPNEFYSNVIMINAVTTALRSGMSALTKIRSMEDRVDEPLRKRHPAKESELN